MKVTADMTKSTFIQRVQRGMQGLNAGLPNGLTDINNLIFGVNKARYYLIGGESGSGKTTLCDFMFLFSPYRYMKAFPEEAPKIKWRYFSFEQGRTTKEDSWASKLIFDLYGQRLNSAYILSKGRNRVSEEHYQLCIGVHNYVEELFDYIDMTDVGITPSAFFQEILKFGALHGKWVTKEVILATGKPKLHPKTQKPVKEVIGWIPNNPKDHYIFIMDHIAYASMEYATLKQNIDTISRTIVHFRDITGWSFAVIQQFNTELASVERQKFKGSAIAPQRVDFGDSRYTYQDADIVLGLLNPHKYDLMSYHNVNTTKKGVASYGIWAFLMKNRHEGRADYASALFMDPVAGTFKELPKPMSAQVIDLGGEDPLLEYYDKAQQFNDQLNQWEDTSL